MLAVPAAESAAPPELDDATIVVYCDLGRRGVKIWLGSTGQLLAGPADYLTDEVRARIAAHRDGLRRAAEHAQLWATQPWGEPAALGLLQATIRGLASVGNITADAHRPTAAEIRAAAAGLRTADERDLVLAFAQRQDAYERIDAAHAAGDHDRARAILHSGAWDAGRVALAILAERFGNRMPLSCAHALGENPDWVACENELQDAIAARSMSGVWLACLAMRAVAATVRTGQPEHPAIEMGEDEW